ncbi:MAG: hypothetical protein ABI132_06565 [Rhodanobacteraceae bacterium]
MRATLSRWERANSKRIAQPLRIQRRNVVVADQQNVPPANADTHGLAE